MRVCRDASSVENDLLFLSRRSIAGKHRQVQTSFSHDCLQKGSSNVTWHDQSASSEGKRGGTHGQVLVTHVSANHVALRHVSPIAPRGSLILSSDWPVYMLHVWLFQVFLWALFHISMWNTSHRYVKHVKHVRCVWSVQLQPKKKKKVLYYLTLTFKKKKKK